MKLRLEIEIEYEDMDDPSAELDEHRQAIDAHLLDVARREAEDHGFAPFEGMRADWTARVVRLDC